MAPRPRRSCGPPGGLGPAEVLRNSRVQGRHVPETITAEEAVGLRGEAHNGFRGSKVHWHALAALQEALEGGDVVPDRGNGSTSNTGRGTGEWGRVCACGVAWQLASASRTSKSLSARRTLTMPCSRDMLPLTKDRPSRRAGRDDDARPDTSAMATRMAWMSSTPASLSIQRCR